MKGDFTRFLYNPLRHYSRVLKQQGRVDLDADWNEAVEIFTQLERSEARDVIGRSGVPEESNGYRVQVTPGGELAVSRGRIYVEGIQCSNELDPDSADPDQLLLLTEQEDLPGYTLPAAEGVYLAYVDVWERHVTYIEDPEIREVALGGPDTTTRTRTLCQIRLAPLGADGPLTDFECQPYPALPNTGRLAARAAVEDEPETPCVVPAGGGYRGLENRLYRVEIHDHGRDEDGNQVRTPTFKWSRDNGSVVLPVAEGGIDGDEVTLRSFGPDDVLTVRVGDWVELLGDETELHGNHGTLGRIEPNGIDRADREITLSEDVSAHSGETHLKLRRWDHQATDDVALQDGALPIQSDWFELEDGVEVRFDTAATYHVGDYWVIPARTREGDVHWPQQGGSAAERRRLGIQHHYATLALVRRFGNAWTEVEDCRNLFPPLTEVDDGGCCVRVMPGEDIQQAIDSVIGAGGGCISLCQGVHEVAGPLWIRNGRNLTLAGQGAGSILRLRNGEAGSGGVIVENSQRIGIDAMMLVSSEVRSLITVRDNDAWDLNRSITLSGLTLVNTARSAQQDGAALFSAVRLGHCDGIVIDRCRIAAEAGVVSLWGDALPALDPQGEPNDEVRILSFDSLQLGSEFRVGDSFSEAGVGVTGDTFIWGNGQSTDGGFARVDDGSHAGGTGREMMVNNINLDFALPGSYEYAQIDFGDFGGNINLRINGQLANVNGMGALHGLTLGGVNVSVVFTDPQQVHGRLVMQQGSQPIASLAVGGQELWIDNVSFRGSEQTELPDLRYGRGVRELSMRDSVIRYTRFGVLGAVCLAWELRRNAILTLPIGRIDSAATLLDEAETASHYAQLQDRLEPFWQGHTGVSVRERSATTAFVALLLWESRIDDCTLAGSSALFLFWAVRCRFQGCRLSAYDTALTAFWLHQCRVRGNRFEVPDGSGAVVGGAYRSRFDANDIRSAHGLLNLPFAAALGHLLGIHGALASAYGVEDETDGYLLYWMMLELSLWLMGLSPLVNALEERLPNTGGYPLTLFLANYLPTLIEQGMEGSGEDAVALPLIDLRIAANQLTCDNSGVVFRSFIPLGSLRISGNRIISLRGQTLRVDAQPNFANAHLSVFLYRTLLNLLLERASDDGDNSALQQLWRDTLQGWLDGSEPFLEVDFRIEGNTLHSLRTAIESNLFELAVVENHITLRERSMRAPVRTGTVFGRVSDAAGNLLGSVSLRLDGSDHTTLTLDDGSYQLSNVTAGSYSIVALRTGYLQQMQPVTVSAGEQVEVNFILEPWRILGSFYRALPAAMEMSWNNAALVYAAAGFTLPVGNDEISRVAAALQRSTAFEPVAVSLREGGYTEPRHFAAYLLSADGPLADPQLRLAAADAVTLVAGIASDEDLQRTAAQLNTALRANDSSAMSVRLPAFLRSLQRFTDSQGILIKGVGCRVVENQVLVPADVDPDTRAFGGVQVSVDYFELALLVLLARWIQQFVLEAEGSDDAGVELNALLGVTETLLDNNEIIGGIGHGISVQGVAGRPDYVQELHIRGNQIRDMAGAGVFCNENAFVVGLNLDANHISLCGQPQGFSAAKGGIVVRAAARCHMHGNHVVQCGREVDALNVLGIDLDTIYGLSFHNNELISNGSSRALLDEGGLRMQEIYGVVSVHDNNFAHNRGTALQWVNSARSGEGALLPAQLLLAVNLYLGTSLSNDQLPAMEQASVQGNGFETSHQNSLPLFRLLNLLQVSFTGNSCRGESMNGALGELDNSSRGLVANNQLHSNNEVGIIVRKMGSGVIHGNVGNVPVEVSASGNIQHGLNIPDVSI